MQFISVKIRTHSYADLSPTPVTVTEMSIQQENLFLRNKSIIYVLFTYILELCSVFFFRNIMRFFTRTTVCCWFFILKHFSFFFCVACLLLYHGLYFFSVVWSAFFPLPSTSRWYGDYKRSFRFFSYDFRVEVCLNLKQRRENKL